jgi:LacI family transcriptional regulator
MSEPPGRAGRDSNGDSSDEPDQMGPPGAPAADGPAPAPEPAQGRATMRDVAALAGVSVKTVSRVVNREAGVTDTVRQRVQAALVRLDYRTNLTASNLRRSGGRTATVGALLQDLGNSFSAGLLRALEDGARERGVAVLAASLDEEPERERALVADLVARRVDGLVLMPASHSQEYLAAERRAGLPTVFVDRSPRGVAADAVTIDNWSGAREATQHLLAQGHRRIAFLGDLTSIQTAVDRYDGYLDGMRQAGQPVDPRWVVRDLRDPPAAYQASRRMLGLAVPPTAIFSSRNVISMGALQALRDAGLSRSVALVGFDDFPLADLVEPALTVVRQDVRRIGACVCDLLFRRLDGDTSPVRGVQLRPTLVLRGSGEIGPGRAALR